MKPITSFFSFVSSASHRAQTVLKIESAKERKRKREAELENQRNNRDQALSTDKNSILSASDNVADACRYEIDRILASEDDYIAPVLETAAWTPRPKNWRTTFHSCLLEIKSDVAKFPELHCDSHGKKLSMAGVESRRKRWIKDYQKELATGKQLNYNRGTNIPVYGSTIDNELLRDMLQKREKGL